MTAPRAKVTVDASGRVVLDDPDARAVLCAIGRLRCRDTLREHAERVAHFDRRMAEAGHDPAEVCVVLLGVNDPHGALLADILVPGYEWDAIRARKEIPYARGLAGRAFMQHALDLMDTDAAAKLRARTGIAVVVVDHGAVDVFRPEQAWGID